MMTRLAVLVFLALALPLLAGPDPEPPGDMTKPLKALQGAWKVSSLAIGGQHLGLDLKMTLTFTAKTLKATQGGTTKEHTFKIDPKKKPMHMDVTDKASGKVSLSIFKIEKDELHIASPKDPDAKKRPAGFDDKEAVVIVLKKEKK